MQRDGHSDEDWPTSPAVAVAHWGGFVHWKQPTVEQHGAAIKLPLWYPYSWMGVARVQQPKAKNKAVRSGRPRRRPPRRPQSRGGRGSAVRLRSHVCARGWDGGHGIGHRVRNHPPAGREECRRATGLFLRRPMLLWHLPGQGRFGVRASFFDARTGGNDAWVLGHCQTTTPCLPSNRERYGSGADPTVVLG